MHTCLVPGRDIKPVIRVLRYNAAAEWDGVPDGRCLFKKLQIKFLLLQHIGFCNMMWLKAVVGGVANTSSFFGKF